MLLCRIAGFSNFSQLAFRLEIVDIYLKRYRCLRKGVARPSTSINCSSGSNYRMILDMMEVILSGQLETTKRKKGVQTTTANLLFGLFGTMWNKSNVGLTISYQINL